MRPTKNLPPDLMKLSPEELEKLIHQNLRALPDRRAPRSLESRVLAAIEARAARPWWKQSYAQWPIAARCVFLLLSGGLVKLAVMATVWAMAGFDRTAFAESFSTQFAWVDRINALMASCIDFAGVVFHSIPAIWLYGGLACFVGLYVTLFGLGAAAYRMLYAQR